MPRRSSRRKSKHDYALLNSRGEEISSSSSSNTWSPQKSSSSSSSSTTASEATLPYDHGQPDSKGLPAIAEDRETGKTNDLEVANNKGLDLDQGAPTQGACSVALLVEKSTNSNELGKGARPKVKCVVDSRGSQQGSDSEDDMQRELEKMREKEVRLREKIRRDRLRREVARKREEVESLQAVADSQSPEAIPKEGLSASTPGKKKRAKKSKSNSIKPNLKIEIDNTRAKEAILFDSDAEIAQMEEDFIEGPVKDSVPIKSKTGQGVSIKDLRRDPKLVNRADQALANMGLFQDDESSEEEQNLQKGTGNKLLKSGMEVKASQRVVQQLLWPHVTLQYEFVSRDLAYKDLDIRLLGAGELEIITRSDISDSEKAGRLEILKNLFYFSTQVDMATVRAMYAAVLRQIEVGSLKWDADPYQIMQLMLMKVWGSKKGRAQEKKVGSTGIWWCRDFQRGSCTYQSSHSKSIKGKDTWVQHICATCWQKQKKMAYHPENSNSCPLKGKREDMWEEGPKRE